MNQAKLSSIASKIIEPMSSQNTLQDALRLMQMHKISSVVIVNDQQKPIGIFTERDALKAVAKAISPDTKLLNIMTKDPFVVHENLRVSDAYVLLESHGFRHLIMVDKNNKYTGIVTEGDFLRNLGLDATQKKKLIQDIMIAAPLIIEENLSVQEVAQAMREKDVDYAIISKNNQPIGIVRERDIAYFFAEKKSASKYTLDAIIPDIIHTVKQDVTLSEAISLMEKHGIHQLVVTDHEEEIVGLIDRHTVLRAIYGAYIDYLMHVVNEKILDIETLSKSKEILSEQTQLLENIIDTIPDLIWLKDTRGRYVTCNKMFERFFGAKREDIIGKTDYDFVDKELADMFTKNDNEAIKLGTSRINEEHLVFKDGSYKGDFEAIKTPLKNEFGTLIGVLGVARDITEKKMQLDILNDAQAIAHIGSWHFNLVDNILTWSDECCRIFGVPITSEINLDIFLSFIHEDDKEKVMQAWEEGLENGNYEVDHRIIVGDSVKWVRERARFILDEITKKPILALGTVQDITQNKKYEDKLLCMANSDHLTGLANRSLLESVLEKSIHISMRNDKKCALLLFDLDYFKDINESFGHKVGDEILKEIAQRLKGRIRQSDLVARICSDEINYSKKKKKINNKEDVIARLGGDEFAIVLSSIDHSEDAAKVAKEIMQLINEPFKVSSELTIHINSSVGIAISPDHSKSPNELLQFADSALYNAKESGRYTFAYYADEMTKLAKEKLEGENKLREAMQNGEFVLYYQPQVYIPTGRIVGVEALVRWKDPKLGIIPPDRFIPIAEQSGLIINLGKWIFEEACRQTKKWYDMGLNIKTAINVSAKQIHYFDIATLVEDTLARLQLPAERIIFEITESAMMQNHKQVVQKLFAVHSLGVKIAIDDFGTGYSSYSYLKRFPIDILKIDKSFVDGIPFDNDNCAITKAIVAMGEALEYKLLAEGVETDEQEKFLSDIGCEFFQGYLKSKPLPPSEVEKLFFAQQKETN